MYGSHKKHSAGARNVKARAKRALLLPSIYIKIFTGECSILRPLRKAMVRKRFQRQIGPKNSRGGALQSQERK